MKNINNISQVLGKNSSSDCSNECIASGKTFFNLDAIPAELKGYPQWVLWKLEQRDGKLTKVPYTVQGYRASVNNPDTWTDFETASAVLLENAGDYSGIGFVLTDDDPFIGFDWDHVRDSVTGDFQPNILEEVTSLNSYAEVSQSGEGVHVIAKGTIPGPKRRSGQREIYSSGRYFAITGIHIEGTSSTVNDVPEPAVKAIYEKIDSNAQSSQNKGQLEKRSVLKNISFTDENIIELCNNAVNGEKFRKLFNGNWEGDYKSRSEADLALCSLVAYHTEDPEQIDRVFSRSKLYREKWDRTDYKNQTISEALKKRKYFKKEVKGSKEDTKLMEPYVITRDGIYLTVIDKENNFEFAYHEDGKIKYTKSVIVDGRCIYPQELPMKNGKFIHIVGIPSKEELEIAETVSAENLCELIRVHINKYVEAPKLDVEMFAYFAIFTWLYKKCNTTPYLRIIGDTGIGKSRIIIVISDLCFYPITAEGASTTSGIMRFNESWHGTLKIDEADLNGGTENEVIKYLNLGFEDEHYFIKTNKNNLQEQQFFDPFCPKVIAMRKPFMDNATEARVLSFTPRQLTRTDIPVNLPAEYKEEVKKIRALMARFVLSNWANIDGSKLIDCKHLSIEPRLRQLSLPLSIIFQCIPSGVGKFEKYMLRRQREVISTRAQSWEGTMFNHVYSLAIGEEKLPEEYLQEYCVDGVITALTPSMVAKSLGATPTSISRSLGSIGFEVESSTVQIRVDGNLKNKKVRRYVLPDEKAWKDVYERYYHQDPDNYQGIGENIPECPKVLRSKKYIE